MTYNAFGGPLNLAQLQLAIQKRQRGRIGEIPGFAAPLQPHCVSSIRAASRSAGQMVLLNPSSNVRGLQLIARDDCGQSTASPLYSLLMQTSISIMTSRHDPANR